MSMAVTTGDVPDIDFQFTFKWVKKEGILPEQNDTGRRLQVHYQDSWFKLVHHSRYLPLKAAVFFLLAANDTMIQAFPSDSWPCQAVSSGIHATKKMCTTTCDLLTK